MNQPYLEPIHKSIHIMFVLVHHLHSIVILKHQLPNPICIKCRHFLIHGIFPFGVLNICSKQVNYILCIAPPCMHNDELQIHHMWTFCTWFQKIKIRTVRSLIWIPLTNFPLPHYFIHQNHWISTSDRILCVITFNLRKVL